MSRGQGSIEIGGGSGGRKHLEPCYVFDQQPTRESVRHGQGWEDVIDEVEERLCPRVAAVSRDWVEGGIRLARWGHEPEVGSITCKILCGNSTYIDLR